MSTSAVSADIMSLDSSTYPHIIHNIIRFSAIPELKAFRCTSRWCREAVDGWLATHLVLEGQLYTDFPIEMTTSVLHNGLWAFLSNTCVYRVYTTEAQKPFEVTEKRTYARGAIHAQITQVPIKIPVLSRARILDIHGTVRMTVLAGLVPKLPNLRTMRIFRGYRDRKTDPYMSSSSTSLFERQDDSDTGPFRRLSIPAPPTVKRVVSFHTLVPAQSLSDAFPHICPLGTEELVVNITFNPAQDDWCGWLPSPAAPPPQLRSATIIFTEINDVGMKRAQYQTDAPETNVSFLDLFGPELGTLEVAITVVGMERLASNATLSGGKSYGEMQTMLWGNTTKPLTFIDLDEYRLTVGENTWELYTHPDDERPRMIPLYGGFGELGTQILGRME